MNSFPLSVNILAILIDVADGKPEIADSFKQAPKIGLRGNARHHHWERTFAVLDTNGCQADLTG